MASGFKRADRVGQLLQQALGQALTRGLKDPRVGFVTVTEVRVTDDLKSARVYFSAYGDEDQRADAMEGLQAATPFLKREISNQVDLKHLPKLTFVHDTSLDYAERIDTLLHAAQDGGPGPDTVERAEPAPFHRAGQVHDPEEGDS